MNKRNFLKIISIIVIAIGIGSITFSKSNHNVNAASWGAKSLFTTPKATRGTWYYKEDGRIKHCKITAHTVDGRKLYKILPEKEYAKWENRVEHQNIKEHRKLISKINTIQFQAYKLKWHGITSFNTNDWVTGAGNGIYYVPVTKTRHGKKVKAIRFGSGAGNYFDRYGYKTKKLAR
ncbi:MULTISPECIES: hypothetical protein [Lactobacillus]|jgi:hypothetical protein|uniref:Uncharacterized protein n=1 Tax=Lactobacillus gallinarum DSM 10532 = JCM 2011 TaxID=1423748 RepID=A0A0R1NUG0_9LACO|nr:MULTISPECIES: hypothetical protein [Lactobacillus]KRL23729.1 hypothetical protein FC37_GL000783 [Lactobacillus gallinarum DSM 10532 = JCM 2011]PEG87693.1 hypothetical protein CP365_00790 [Lactobacillus sp. UMNPBX14]PEH01857.1 hypothetical protein CP357_08855 [Lactobacillus sp. UMNPBX6]